MAKRKLQTERKDVLTTDFVYPDFDNVIRESISKEDQLLNRRMKWNILFQTILFATYEHMPPSVDIPYWWIFPVMGIMLSLNYRYSVWVSSRAIGFLLFRWDEHTDRNHICRDLFPPVWSGSPSTLFKIYPEDEKEPEWIQCFYKRILFHMGWFMLYKFSPWVFIFGWLTILYYQSQ